MKIGPFVALGDITNPLPAHVEEKLAERAAIRGRLRWEDGGSVGDGVPLSAGQLSMCFTQMQYPRSARFNNGFEFAITGDLAVTALEQAWQQVLRVHPLLRLGIRWNGGEPQGFLHPVPSKVVEAFDFSGSEQGLKEAQTQHAASMLRPFDIEEDCLWRVVLSRTGPAGWWLSVIFHHLIIDGISFRLVFAELGRRYAQELAGQSALHVDDGSGAFAEFVHSQRHWLQEAESHAALAMIQQHLTGAPMLALPNDFEPDPATLNKSGPAVDCPAPPLTGELPAEWVSALRQLAKARGTTLFGVLYAAWVGLLARWTGEEEILCGVPAAARVTREMRGLVGPLFNTVVPRVRIDPGMSLLELVDVVRDELLDCLNWAHLPIEAVIADADVPRDQHDNALFNNLFNFYPEDPAQLELASCTVSGKMGGQLLGEYAFNLLIIPNGGTLHFSLTYDPRRFMEATLSRLLQRWQIFLKAMLDEPQQALGEVEIWTNGERQMVCDWSCGPTTDYPRDASLAQLFVLSVQRHRQGIALTDGERNYSFAELDAESDRLGRLLQARGLHVGTVCALRLNRSAGYVIAVLAIVKCGAIYFPVDPQQPLERLQFSLEDSTAVLMLVDESWERSLRDLPCPVIDIAELLAADPAALPPFAAVLDRSADSCVNLMYTSGSTGVPKGIEVTHRGIIRLVHGQVHYPFGADAVYLFSASISFDSSTRELWACLLNGAHLITLPPDSYDPAIYAAMIRRHRVTHVSLTTALFHLFVEEFPDAFAELRYLLIGGEALQREPALRFIRANPGCQLVNIYGPTENTTDTTWFVVDKQLHPRIRSVPIGRPIANTSTFVLDATGQLCPIGIAGELYNGGDGLAIGYRNRPEAHAAAFITVDSPFHCGRLYRTGDRCRWLESGELEFIGRLDKQVKYRGYRIELGEIESALRAQAGVQDALVFLANDASGQPGLFAAVCGGQELDPLRIRSQLNNQIPAYMLPEGIAVLPEFPLVAGCKPDRKAIFTQLLERLESSRQKQVCDSAEDSLTEFEQQIATQLRELLGPIPIGPYDALPALGMHSLRLVRLRLRLERVLGCSVPLSMLLQNPVLRDLASALQSLVSGSGTAAPALPEWPVVGEGECAPLIWSQLLIWNAQMASDHPDAYNVSVLLQLRQAPDRPRLLAALAQVMRQQEGLRTGFRTDEDGSPLQFAVADCLVAPVMREGLDSAGLAEFVAEFQALPFDLAKPPLLRIAMLVDSGDSCQLLICFHHLIMDGEGLKLFLREWDAAWHSRPVTKVSNLRALALWQKLPVVDEWLREDLAWWQQQLDALPAQSWLDSLPRPAAEPQRALPVNLPDHLPQVGMLRRHAEQLGCTLHDLLFAAFSRVLGALSGLEELCIGVAFAHTEGGGHEGIIGSFVNSLPVRMQLDGQIGFTDWLSVVALQLRDAYAHGRLPFALLCQQLDPRRHPRADQVFAALFSLVERESVFDLFDGAACWLPCPHNSAKAPLSLSLFVDGEQLSGHLDFDPAVFSRNAAHAVAQAFAVQLHAIARNTDDGNARSFLMEEEELQHLLRIGTGPAPSPAIGRSVYQVFAETAAAHVDSVAIRHGDDCWSYGRLENDVQLCAARLWQAGVHAGMSVGVESLRHPRRIIAELSLLRLGAVFVPLDFALPFERLSQCVDSAKVQVIVVCGDPTSVPAIPGLRTLPVFEAAIDCPVGEAPVLPPVPRDPDQTAYIMFTSGSTGLPKAIAIPHRGIIRLVVDCNYTRIRPGDRIAHLANPAFDAVTFEVWGALLNGATTVIHEPPLIQTLERFSTFLREQAISHLFLTTGLFNTISRLDPDAFATINWLMVGGERLDVEAVSSVLNARAPDHLLNVYGPTENTTFSCAGELALADCVETDLPIGRPISGTSALVVNRWSQLLPPPFIGELWLGGVGLAKGYLGEGSQNTAFVQAAFHGETCRWYRSGDLFWLDQQGRLRFAGRRDGQIKLRGHRIELSEIAAVAGTHPGVAQAFALVAGSASDERQILLYYITQTVAVSEHDLRGFLQARLPGYMLPSAINEVAEFPLNANGKIDQAALLNMRPIQAEGGIEAPPASEVESALVRILQALLPHASIHRGSDFFAHGGNSLSAFRLLARIKTELGQELRLAQLLGHPTPAELARLLRQPNAAVDPGQPPVSSLVPMHAVSGDARAALIGVYGHGFHGSPLFWQFLGNNLGTDLSLYGLQSGGLVGFPIAECSLAELAARHALEIKAVIRHPIILLGYCTGGFLAWELACQLHNIGAEVQNVILVDTLSPLQRQVFIRRVLRQRLWQRIRSIQVIQLLAVLGRFVKRTQLSLQSRGPSAADNLSALIGQDGRIPFSQREAHTYERLAQIFEAWRPSRLPGQVHLLRSIDIACMPNDCGWGQFSTGNIQAHQTNLPHHMSHQRYHASLTRHLLKALRT